MDGENMKLITIIIPCYNVENYIDRCMGSIVGQTIGIDKLQVICVDDASTDGTWDKLKMWEQKYPEDVMLIKCEENGRQGTARNIALQYAVADLIGYVDSDDWIEPAMYEKMYDKVVKYDCDIVFCRNFRSSQYVLAQKTERCKDKDCIYEISSENKRKQFIVDNVMGYGCWDKLIKKSLLIDNNITFPEKLAYEDIYWGSQLYLYAKKIYMLEEKLYHYFVNEESTVLSQNRTYHKDIFKINEMKWDMYGERGFLDNYRQELEFDYIITGYLAGIKALALRYTTDTYDDFIELCQKVKAKMDNPMDNPYVKCLSEFNKLQVQLINTQVPKAVWEQFCGMYRQKAGV